MNIFNDVNGINNTNNSGGTSSFTNLTVQNLVAQNAEIDNLACDVSAVFTGGIETNALQMSSLSSGDILVTSNSGVVNGLAIAVNNDVLTSNGVTPVWTNSLTLNSLNSNSLGINGTSNGDLLVMNSSSIANRLAIGSSGYFLISNGSIPQWEPLPSPLTLGSLIVNSTCQFTNYLNKTLITDNSGALVSETPQLSTNGSTSFSTTTSTIYSYGTWSFSGGGWYKVKWDITTSNTTSFHGNIGINNVPIQYINYLGSNIETLCGDFIYQYTGASSSTVGIEIILTSSGTSNLSGFNIYVERVPAPNSHP